MRGLVYIALIGATACCRCIARMKTRSALRDLAHADWCEDRAREWQPRLWDRDEDPRDDARERRP